MSPPQRRKRRRRRTTPGSYNPAATEAKGANPEEKVAPLSASEQPAPSVVVSLEPLAPIIVRSGRPLEGNSDADPARFPPPSTVAGCLRTAWARATAQPFGPELAQLAVAGPLLLGRSGRPILAPKPADALYFGHGGSARCVRAEPCAFDAGCDADLPDDLLPLQLTERVSEKPSDGPVWWSWEDLLDFREGKTVAHAQLCENGWSPPPGDRRTHVAIDPKTGAADNGRLFQTEGLDLDAPHNSGPPAAGGLRLLVRCGEALDGTLVHLGGKRRLSALRPEPEEIWPKPPQDWLDHIARAGGLCLTLLTPAIFSAGYRPGWLDKELIGSPPGIPGLRLQLRAAAVDRWQPHSGWDLARRRPRATRKLACPGAAYWFRILGNADRGRLNALWLTNISDLGQDRRDGFGLVLPSPWKPPVDRNA